MDIKKEIRGCDPCEVKKAEPSISAELDTHGQGAFNKITPQSELGVICCNSTSGIHRGKIFFHSLFQ